MEENTEVIYGWIISSEKAISKRVYGSFIERSIDCVTEEISCVIYNMYIRRIEKSLAVTGLDPVLMQQKR